MTSVLPWRTDAEIDDDDREAAAMHAKSVHNEAVSKRIRELRVNDEAKARLAAERAGEQPPFDAGTLAELLARAPAPQARVQDLIPAEAGTLVVAQRKTGKTTFELNLARSLIEGSDFLGRFGVRKITGNVALLNFEVSGPTIAAWARDHQIAHHRLFVANLRGRRNPLREPTDREELARLLRLHDVETLIVDPFGRAFTGTNQNDPGEVGAFLSDLDVFARGHGGAGCTDLILAAHAGWNGERSRGSTALEDWGDSIITLTRDKDDDQQRFLRAEGRDVLVDEDQLHYDKTSRTLSLTGAGSRRTAATVRKLEALSPLVIRLLTDDPGMSGNQLDLNLKNGDLPHSKGDGARAAQLLEKNGLVRTEPGSRGSRKFYLTTSPTSPNLPQGLRATSPTSLIEGEVARELPSPTPLPQGTNRERER